MESLSKTTRDSFGALLAELSEEEAHTGRSDHQCLLAERKDHRNRPRQRSRRRKSLPAKPAIDSEDDDVEMSRWVARSASSGDDTLELSEAAITSVRSRKRKTTFASASAAPVGMDGNPSLVKRARHSIAATAAAARADSADSSVAAPSVADDSIHAADVGSV